MDSVNLTFRSTQPFYGDQLPADVTVDLHNDTSLTLDGMVLDGMFKYADLGVQK